MLNRGKLFIPLAVLGGLAIIGGIILTLNASLAAVVQKTNELDLAQTEQSVRAALSSATDSLVGMVTDNAFWTVAYEQVNRSHPDANWFLETWGTTAETGKNYDGVVILNPDMSVWWGHAGALDFEGSGKLVFSGRLAHDGIVMPDEDDKVVKGIVDLGGAFALVAIERIRPAEGDAKKVHPSNRALMMYKLIDDDLLADLSFIFDIDHLAIEKPGEQIETGIELASPNGTRIGTLTWTARNPGEEAAAVVRPKIEQILIAICGMVAAFVVILAIALRKLAASERHARLASLTDHLTGMPNRHALHQRIEADFHPKQRFKLLLIDLDRFKNVNDSHGHFVGDKLLIEVARRIRAALGQDGFAARLGGDEIAVLVYGDLGLACDVADKIVDAIGQPFQFGSIVISVGCSIGMCCTDDASDATELMQRSDIALYEAKRNGRGRTSCYQPGMLEAVVDRQNLGAAMQVAAERGEFFLAYQPVVALAENSIIGYEALIRWDHPERGQIPPVSFIPLAEETGQIVEIGRWVLEEACREAASWSDDRYVAVNVSAVQLRSPLFISHLTKALANSGLPAYRLEIELTETALVEDGEQIATVLRAIRGLGVRIAMDDFGTGYSSLSHLRDFPLDRIKVDRSFVSTAETDRHSLAVLRGITKIAQELKVDILAEGVETPSQLELLRKIGCDAVQGYLVGRPQRLRLAATPLQQSA